MKTVLLSLITLYLGFFSLIDLPRIAVALERIATALETLAKLPR